MAEIFPFAAYRYNPQRVELAKVLTQPYDKITPAMQEWYYSLSPYNLIRVEKGRGSPGDSPADNVYTRAARALEGWIAEGILARDPAPWIYACAQEYRVPGSGQVKVRKGFIALGRVEDYSARVVFRHEQTLSGPKADRLELLRHTRTHTGQLFMLYSDPAREIEALLEEASGAPAEARDEYGVIHRLRPIEEPRLVQRIVAGMRPQKLVIADGHHRYETALAYRDECRAAPAGGQTHEKVMMTFFNTCAEGLTILPTHRVVFGLGGFRREDFFRRLELWFELREQRFARAEEREAAWGRFRSELAQGAERRVVGIYTGGGAFYLLALRPEADLGRALPGVTLAERQLDVVLLHRLVLEKGLGITAEAVAGERNIRYERDMEAAIAAVDRDGAQACCLLNPVRIEQVMEMALGGQVLPQKSTDFYPKLLSGMVLYRLEGG